MQTVSTSHVTVNADSHAGESGKNNEDRYGLAYFKADSGDPVTLAIVADGIGGHRAGEVASELAVSLVTQAVAEGQGDNFLEMLARGVARASAEISRQAMDNLDYRGMGTTCAAALVVGQRLHTAYVGDSRLYLRHNGSFRQISIDHTWIQAALEHNLIAPEEIKGHPNQHMVLRHLGGKVEARADFRLRLADTETPAQSEANQGLTLAKGDQVLICSDGLSDLVHADEIDAMLRKSPGQAGVDELIGLARKRGGHDNITIILIQMPA